MMKANTKDVARLPLARSLKPLPTATIIDRQRKVSFSMIVYLGYAWKPEMKSSKPDAAGTIDATLPLVGRPSHPTVVCFDAAPRAVVSNIEYAADARVSAELRTTKASATDMLGTETNQT